jgi:hypothetical protein
LAELICANHGEPVEPLAPSPPLGAELVTSRVPRGGRPTRGGPRASVRNPELTCAGGRGIGPRDLGKVGRKQRNRPMEWFGGNSLFFLLSSLFLIHLNLNF